MKNTFSRKFTVCALAGVLGVAFIACGDDGSSSPKGTGLPAEVGDMAELETYECSMDVIGEKVYVTELEENYECDGEKWFRSYDQTKPSSTKSSGSKDTDGSSDSRATDKDGSSSDATTSSSSAKSSSSRPTEILEPEITVNETCTEVGACDAMVKTDISTWHFVRKDDFGDDAEYTYTVDGKDLIVTIKSADGTINTKTYSMYNMESEAGVEMAFNAAKSTCKNGGGNDNKIKSCVKDTVKALYYAENNTLTDLRDGQVYKTTTIDIPSKNYSEVWMAENLNYETDKSWCYGDDPANCAKYGRLYTWAAAVGRDEDECGIYHACNLGEGDIRGACPKGWHLPSQSEWEALIVAVDGSITEYTSSNTAGTKLKSATGWTAYSGITNEDAFGFSALPAGTRYHPIGNYGYKGYGTYFWSSTEEIISYPAYRHAYLMGLDYGNDYAGKYDNDKVYGHSVRCIKDSE